MLFWTLPDLRMRSLPRALRAAEEREPTVGGLEAEPGAPPPPFNSVTASILVVSI